MRRISADKIVKRTRADRRRAALLGIRRAKAAARERSERVKRSWKVRRKRYGPSGRKKKRGGAPPIPPKKTREYFVVASYPKKRGEKRHRLIEAILTLPDGATEDEIYEAYGKFLIEKGWNPKAVKGLLLRDLQFKIVPRDTPGSEAPSGSVRINDARNPKKRRKRK